VDIPFSTAQKAAQMQQHSTGGEFSHPQPNILFLVHCSLSLIKVERLRHRIQSHKLMTSQSQAFRMQHGPDNTRNLDSRRNQAAQTDLPSEK
jgi:hypothetical protein